MHPATHPAHVPRLRYRITRRDDLAECMSLLPSWLALGADIEQALPRLWADLVSEPAWLSMVMEDLALPRGQRIQAWGVSVALQPDAVERLAISSAARPHLARQVYTALLDGTLVPMNDQALGRANADGQLWLLCLHFGTRFNDFQHPYGQALLAIGNESLRFGMSGYQLQGVYYENHVEADPWMSTAGFLPRPFVAGTGEAGVDELHHWGMTQDEARRIMPGSTVRHLFEAHPPRFRLSLAQRRLLWHALFYEDDELLARELDTSAHGLKKLWRGIYERIEDTVPDFFGDASVDDDGKRGPEKRRQVLAYVRQRLEELRPWVAA